MLRYIEYSFQEPPKNLALDEVLLDGVNDGHTEATLRVWESPLPFVVLGTSQSAAQVAHLENCKADGVPVLRRCSAGGCVLQGPGSLNFTLALDFRTHTQLSNLHESYCWVLKKISLALEELELKTKHEGICDLTLEGRKVSGNAQRRRRNAVLHHGTLLYAFDPLAMRRYLPEPEDRPEYRGSREHGSFMATLPVERDKLVSALVKAFDASKEPLPPSPWEIAESERLAIEKYTDPAWNFRR